MAMQAAAVQASGRLNELSAREVAQGIAAKKFTAEAVVRDCLDRIAAREPIVHAWASIDPDYALAQARERDKSPSRGPLHGVPIGVKDIINTEHYPTEMGSPLYNGNRSHGDAACVALARMAGAVILGKTVTAEFAGMFPGPTANPHNPAHTPGGSSRARRRRSPTSTCRSPTAPRPAARCCARRPIAAVSASSRPST